MTKSWCGTGGLRRQGHGPSFPPMKPVATLNSRLLAICVALTMPVFAQQRDPDFDAVDGPNVRIMRHDDGSRTLFTRSPDNRTLTKKKLSGNGVLTMLTVYRMDGNENPLSCKIFDGGDNCLFKVSYGYRKSDGQLVEERMFDARVVRRDPATGREMPVQVVKYVYDAEGNRSAPIVYNLLPGKTFEEVFGVKSSALETNPFHEKNPAHPAGR